MRSAFTARATTLILALCLFLFLTVEALRAHLAYLIGIFDFDRYQVYEAARELIVSGVARLTYLPNSSVALDILYWSHHLLAYIYALPVRFLRLTYVDLDLLTFFELPLILLLIFASLRRVASTKVAVAILLLSLFDPAFHFIFVEKLLYRWAYIFALLAFIALQQISINKQKKGFFWGFSAGLFSSLSPLSFISLGLPVAAANSVFVILRAFKSIPDGEFNLRKLTFYFCGALLAPLLLIAYLTAQLAPGSLSQIFTIIAAYGKTVSVDAAHGAFSEHIGFVVSLLCGGKDGSLLPLALLSLLFNWRQRTVLDRNEYFFVSYGIAAAASWIVLALLVPTHFYAVRLSWLLPTLLASAAIAIRHRKRDIKLFQVLTLLAVLLLALGSYVNAADEVRAGKALHQWQALALGMIAAGLLAATLWSEKRLLPGRWLLTLVLLAGVPLVSLSLANEIAIARQHRLVLATREFSEPLFHSFARSVRQVTIPALSGKSRVLTNMPAKEFFPENIKLQIVFYYRGLFSGARLQPADKIILFFLNGQQRIGGYDTIDTNSNIYYRGFCYTLNDRRPLPSNFSMLLGDPHPCETLAHIQHPANEPSHSVLNKYLHWREDNGLAID